MEFILEYKLIIISLFVIIMGAGGWHIGYSETKAEQNEGVGFADPELGKGLDKMRVAGRFLTFVGIALLMYQIGKQFLGF